MLLTDDMQFCFHGNQDLIHRNLKEINEKALAEAGAFCSLIPALLL